MRSLASACSSASFTSAPVSCSVTIELSNGMTAYTLPRVIGPASWSARMPPGFCIATSAFTSARMASQMKSPIVDSGRRRCSGTPARPSTVAEIGPIASFQRATRAVHVLSTGPSAHT